MIQRFCVWIYAMVLYSIPPMEERKKVVIIGGGFAGTLAAQRTEDHFHVTLIDTKDFFEFTPSVLRTIVEPTHIKKLQVIHSHYLKSTYVLQKEALSITNNKVILDDREIPFDYLIINSGSTYQSPFKESAIISSARANTLRDNFHTIRRAHSILIIGGGLVGVELAAEIITFFPGKSVTLVHSQSTLISRFPKRAIRYCEEFLRSRKVNLIFRQRITGNKTPQCYVTDQGTEVVADVAFLCTGIQPNSKFMHQNYADTLTPSGYITTNDYLQLKGDIISPNIFVAGDVVDAREEKLAQGAEEMACLVTNNIKCLERGKEPQKYVSPSARPILISLGRYHCVFVFGGFAFTGPLPALLKEAVEWKTLMRYI